MKMYVNWKFFVIVWAVGNAALRDGIWKLDAPNTRYQNANALLASLNISLQMCSSMCLRRMDCVSFNYHDVDRTCELLNYHPIFPTNLLQQQSWGHFTFLPPQLKKKELCPRGSVFVRYEYPVFLKYDPSFQDYACSSNAWVKAQYANGNTECKMTIMYLTDFPYKDDPVDFYIVAPFTEGLKKCQAKSSCLGMVTLANMGQYFLKTDTQLTATGINPSASTCCHYWYTECSKP